MARFVEFEGSYCGRYVNALHAAYHQHQRDELDEITGDYLKKMHLEQDQIDRYKELVEELVDRSRETTVDAGTEERREHDSVRDNEASMLFFTVQNRMKSSDPEVRAAAVELEKVLRPYMKKGLQNQADDVETQLIDGMLKDLEADAHTEAVELLHLGDILRDLAAANDAFRLAKKIRMHTQGKKYRELDTKECRKMADDELEEIKDLIRASGIILTADLKNADPDDKTAIEDDIAFITSIINAMNDVTRSFKTTFNQMEGQKARRDNEKDKNPGKDPEPEEQPTEPDTPEEPDGGEDGETEGGGTHFEPVDPDE